MIDAGNRGIGGRRFALPAFFALTLIGTIALVIATTNRASGPASAPAATLPMAVTATGPTPVTETAARDSRQRDQRLALEVERAMVSNNPQQREAAFNRSLPELLDADPARVIELTARQEGEARDVLRDEVVRLWIRKDRDAALVWMGSFENEWERKAAATVAMRTLAAIEPAQAVAVADQFGVGRDDGSLEHIVQIWATENLEASLQWLEIQPDNPQTAPLRARIEQVREQQLTSRQ